YNPHHPIAEQLAWDSVHAPHVAGFSHHVDAAFSKQNGETIIESIKRVVSVDLVTDPATTTGLYESSGDANESGDGLSIAERLHGRRTLSQQECEDVATKYRGYRQPKPA